MPKLFLLGSLLLIIKTSSAQTANDKNKNINAPNLVCINGLKVGDSLPRKQLLDAKGIECCWPGLKVISFTLASGDGNCIGGSGTYTETNSSSDQFTNQMIEMIKRVKSGFPIWIHNIMVKNTRDDTYRLQTKAIIITDKD